jgi:DNA-binding NarL/FixJ family response regulator
MYQLRDGIRTRSTPHKGQVPVIRILLADDHPAVRLGLRTWLSVETDVQIVGEAADGAEALALALALRPDVVVIDVEMPVMDGMSATTALHAAVPRSAVVMLSMHDDARMRQRAVAAGASAFVAKQEIADHLLAAIRQAAAMADPPL